MSDAPVSDPIAQFRAAADPRDRDFVDYWTSRIDLSDPAAPHWMEHFNLRIGECRKMLAQIEAQHSLSGVRALDVGCQTGALAVLMGERGAEVTGVDTQDWVVEAARRRAAGWGVRAKFEVARGEALPFEGEQFDVVTFVDVIEHCVDAHQCLREIARVLRPGGIAYVLGPNRYAPDWFVRDPHYQLMGASVLPNRLGRAYVEWRRGRPGYDVGVFPVGTQVARTLRQSKLEIVESPIQGCERWWNRRVPETFARGIALARAWGVVRLTFLPTFILVARKPEHVGRVS